MSAAIEHYALIGDCETAALVALDGSIDWLCWPRFDSGACFAALLGDASNGRWRIAPANAATVTRQYRRDTLILETRFSTDTGVVVMIDFMPPRGAASDLIRIVVGEGGEVEMRTELIVRFGYGAYVPWVTRVEDKTWRAVAGPDMVTWSSSVSLHGEDNATVGHFKLHAGERAVFVMTYSPSHQAPPAQPDVDVALSETEEFWREWAGRNRIECGWSQAVMRSLITLRALTYAPTGGIIAAPTTSLPENPGGQRNWDYRYCWLRDATLTLLAFLDAGYVDEARAWRDWLVRAVAGSASQMQIMYGIAGERRLSEWEATWLKGFGGARPVRIGNAAHSHLQLDVYGEVMDALHQARLAGLHTLQRVWSIQCELLTGLEDSWQLPDRGIWEVRGPQQHFTHSKIMCWVAFDRAIKDAENYGFGCPIEQWRRTRDRIHGIVCERGFDSELNSFVQAFGSKQLDASLLLIPVLGFLPPEDSRVRGTIAAIERELMHDGLVRRYNTAATDDGMREVEGAFLACSFWLVDAYVMCGRMHEAVELFERLLGLCNDVGLLAEEYDPTRRRMLGNFPQAFSHLSLVGSAFNLSQRLRPASQRSERDGAPPGGTR